MMDNSVIDLGKRIFDFYQENRDAIAIYDVIATGLVALTFGCFKTKKMYDRWYEKKFSSLSFEQRCQLSASKKRSGYFRYYD